MGCTPNVKATRRRTAPPCTCPGAPAARHHQHAAHQHCQDAWCQHAPHAASEEAGAGGQVYEDRAGSQPPAAAKQAQHPGGRGTSAGQAHSGRTHRAGPPLPDRLLKVGVRASTVASSVWWGGRGEGAPLSPLSCNTGRACACTSTSPAQPGQPAPRALQAPPPLPSSLTHPGCASKEAVWV